MNLAKSSPSREKEILKNVRSRSVIRPIQSHRRFKYHVLRPNVLAKGVSRFCRQLCPRIAESRLSETRWKKKHKVPTWETPLAFLSCLNRPGKYFQRRCCMIGGGDGIGTPYRWMCLKDTELDGRRSGKGSRQERRPFPMDSWKRGVRGTLGIKSS